MMYYFYEEELQGDFYLVTLELALIKASSGSFMNVKWHWMIRYHFGVRLLPASHFIIMFFLSKFKSRFVFIDLLILAEAVEG